MNKSKQKLVFIAAFVFAALLLFFWKSTGKSSTQSVAQFYSYNWENKYGFQSKDPKGLYLFFTLMKIKHPNQKITEIKSFSKFDSVLKENKNATFVFIGDTIGLLDDDLKLLLNKFNQGSTILFSSNVLGGNIEDTLFQELERGFDYDESVNYRLEGKNLKFTSLYQTDTVASEWIGFKNFQSTMGQIDGLVKQENLTTLFRISGVKSNLFFQSNPEPFLNYQMKTTDGFNHANYVLSLIPNENPIYYISIAQIRPLMLDDDSSSSAEEDEKGLLDLILNNKTLLNAMVLVLLGAILFIVFRSKRRKSILPIIHEQQGVTLTFVQSIASIFLNKQNPIAIREIQRKNFYDTVHRYFYIDLHRKNDFSEIELLAEKTSYPLEKLQKLMKGFHSENQALGNDYILNISKLQHDFYRHCGIIGNESLNTKATFEVSRNIGVSAFLILSGLTLTFLGLYFLMISNGSGVILWILGFLLLSFGVIRMMLPHLKMKGKELIYFNTIGIKTKVGEVKVKKVEKQKIILEINDREVFIPIWDTMRSDVAQLKRVIYQNKKL